MNEIGGFRFRPEDSAKIAKTLQAEQSVEVDIACSEDVSDVVHDVQRYGLYRVENERLDTRSGNEMPDFYGRLAFVLDPEQSERIHEGDKRYIDFYLTETELDSEYDEQFWI